MQTKNGDVYRDGMKSDKGLHVWFYKELFTDSLANYCNVSCVNNVL